MEFEQIDRETRTYLAKINEYFSYYRNKDNAGNLKTWEKAKADSVKELLEKAIKILKDE